jgi:hypothetical protein
MTHSTTETSNSVNKSIPKYNRPHLIVPSDDMDWVLDQKPAIQALWKESWKCDPYGSRFVQFSTSLSKSAFAAARKVLKEAGLFEFKADINKSDNRKTDGWLVKNLHGARQLDFWANKPEKLQSSQKDLEPTTENYEYSQKYLESFYKDCNLPQTLTQQASYNVSGSIQELSINNKEKEINNSSTPSEEYIYKPDIYKAHVTEKNENVKQYLSDCENKINEATLNATPQNTQIVINSPVDTIAEEEIPTCELCEIAKAEYGSKLPETPSGKTRKVIRLEEDGKTNIHLLLLPDMLCLYLKSLTSNDDPANSRTRQFLQEHSTLHIATFSFIGRKLVNFDLRVGQTC